MKSKILGVLFAAVAVTSVTADAEAITYNQEYNYYNSGSLVDWSKEWLLLGSTGFISFQFDLTEEGYDNNTSIVESVTLNVTLADDNRVIYPHQSDDDSPILDGNEWGSIDADGQVFQTPELNNPAVYSYDLLTSSIQSDSILDVTVFATNQGDFVFDRATLAVTASVVPVPAAVWLFGSGLIGLIGIAKRKKTLRLNIAQ